MRFVDVRCRATIGEVGNAEQSNINWGKAGRMRWKGKRPTVRGVVMNPVPDHRMVVVRARRPVDVTRCPLGQARGAITRSARPPTPRSSVAASPARVEVNDMPRS